MRNIFLILALGVVLNACCQSTNHNIFGVNLDLDWYSLTGNPAITYKLKDADESIKYLVTTDCYYYLENIDTEFENLNFDSHLIGFKKGYEAEKSILEQLQPILLIGRYNYKDLATFQMKGFLDAKKLRDKLINLHGNPELKIEKSDFIVYKWVVGDLTIIVNSLEKDLRTALTCSIKRN